MIWMQGLLECTLISSPSKTNNRWPKSINNHTNNTPQHHNINSSSSRNLSSNSTITSIVHPSTHVFHNDINEANLSYLCRTFTISFKNYTEFCCPWCSQSSSSNPEMSDNVPHRNKNSPARKTYDLLPRKKKS